MQLMNGLKFTSTCACIIDFSERLLRHMSGQSIHTSMHMAAATTIKPSRTAAKCEIDRGAAEKAVPGDRGAADAAAATPLVVH